MAFDCARQTAVLSGTPLPLPRLAVPLLYLLQGYLPGDCEAFPSPSLQLGLWSEPVEGLLWARLWSH
jgi:hypothetical protein